MKPFFSTYRRLLHFRKKQKKRRWNTKWKVLYVHLIVRYVILTVLYNNLRFVRCTSSFYFLIWFEWVEWLISIFAVHIATYVRKYIGANVKHFECMSQPMNEALLCTYAWLDFAYYTADTITSLIWRNKFAYASATKLNSQFAGIDTVIRSYAKIQIMYIYTLVQPPVLAHLKFSKIKNEFFFVFFWFSHL